MISKEKRLLSIKLVKASNSIAFICAQIQFKRIYVERKSVKSVKQVLLIEKQRKNPSDNLLLMLSFNIGIKNWVKTARE